MQNSYGLDVSYFKGKLELVLRDINNYTPDELARELARLSATASTDVMLEPEFHQHDSLVEQVRQQQARIAELEAEQRTIRFHLVDAKRVLSAVAFPENYNIADYKDMAIRQIERIEEFSRNGGSTQPTTISKELDKYRLPADELCKQVYGDSAKPQIGKLHAVRAIDNEDGQGDVYECLASVNKEGQWVSDETGKPLIEYEGDKILEWWPLYAGTGNKPAAQGE